jgi:hypothetical protein
MYIRLRNRNLRFRRLRKYLGKHFANMWPSSRPQAPDCRQRALCTTQKAAVYATGFGLIPRESSCSQDCYVNGMFRRLDSNQNNRDQNPVGCQLPYAGLMRQIGPAAS